MKDLPFDEWDRNTLGLLTRFSIDLMAPIDNGAGQIEKRYFTRWESPLARNISRLATEAEAKVQRWSERRLGKRIQSRAGVGVTATSSVTRESRKKTPNRSSNNARPTARGALTHQ